MGDNTEMTTIPTGNGKTPKSYTLTDKPEASDDIPDTEGGERGKTMEEHSNTQDEFGGCFSRMVESVETVVHGFLAKHRQRTKTATHVLLLLTYFSYFIYCMHYRFGDEGSIVLLFITICLVWKLGFVFLAKRGVEVGIPASWSAFLASHRGLRLRNILRIGLYLAASTGVIVYLGLDVFQENPTNIQAFVGIIIMVCICFVLSAKPSKVNWHPVFWSMVIQFCVAIITLRTEAGYRAFNWLGDQVQSLLAFAGQGSEFVIGKNYAEMGIAFRASGIIIFVNGIVFLLNHWGVIEFVVLKLGRFLAFCLETGPVESVVAAANIFLGLSEAPLLIRPYIATITKSELHTVMTCGFASISGGAMGIFIAAGAPPNHLLTAAVISAPAALAFSKLLYPEREIVSLESQTNIRMTDTENSKANNSLNMFSAGAVIGLAFAGSIWSNMLAFVSMLKLLNSVIGWIGDRAGINGLDFEVLCSYILYPLAYCMGVDAEDRKNVGALIGVKLFATPVVGYENLGQYIHNRETLEEYVASSPNHTWYWEGSDVILEATNQTLVNGIMTKRSEVISTYALCGFSAFTAIGICLGSLIPLCPQRKADISSLVLRAFLAGNMASFTTGAVAGVLYSS